MTALKFAAFFVLALAGSACLASAKKERELRSAGALLLSLLAFDLVRLVIAALILGPARAAGRVPYEGAERAAFHATQVLGLAWPFGAAALCWRVFAHPRTGDLVAAAWIGISVLFATEYPRLRGELFAEWLLWTKVGCLVLGLSALLTPRTSRVGRAHLVSLLILAGLTAELAGPHLGDVFSLWWIAQATWIPALLGVALVAAWRSPWGKQQSFSLPSDPSRS